MKKFFAKCEDEVPVFNVFAMVVYIMVIFPKALNHIEVAVVNLVIEADPVPTIIAKTICSLNFSRKKRRRSVYRVCATSLYFE